MPVSSIMQESPHHTTTTLRRLHMDRDQATAIVGRFGIVIWRGETTVAGVEHVREMGLELLRQAEPPACMLGIVENTAAVPNADTRRLSAKINDEMAEKGVVGYAALIPTPGFAGAWIRGVVTALNLLARRRYPFRVFESTDDACSWLAQVLGDSTMAARGVAWFHRSLSR
ncbi:MAG: hypothetical protein QM784_12895 [Polyangiaceae bacterium]